MMKLPIIEAVLVAGILVGIGGHLALPDDPSKRAMVFAPEMMDSGAYEAQDPNPNFSDGKTLQALPEGTIARGHLPFVRGDGLLDGTTEWEKLSEDQRAGWNALGAEQPWESLKPGDKARILQRGAYVFQTFCQPCHGAGGTGDGVVVKRGGPPPKSFLAPDIRALSDGQMFRSITYGKGNMAPYASQVEREDRWKAIRYIRSLQQVP
jgi:mono/diheme cytochrome c family protein